MANAVISIVLQCNNDGVCIDLTVPSVYPVPFRHRDQALGRLPALDARALRSRGRFGASMYEVSKQDDSFAPGIKTIDRLTCGEEEANEAPDRVNGRRRAPLSAR